MKYRDKERGIFNVLGGGGGGGTLLHVAVVVERFPHAHHDHVGEAPGVVGLLGEILQVVLDSEKLEEDLAGREVAEDGLGHGAGVTELAGEGASHLR